MTNLDVSQALYAVEAAIAGRAAARDLPAPRTLDRDEWPPDYGQVLAWREQQLARFAAEPALLASAKAYYAGADLYKKGITDPKPWSERCADWINHWVNTYDPRNAGKPGMRTQMPLVMFRRQEALIHFLMACMMGDAPGLVEKARTMGATWTGISFSVWLWLFQPGVAVGWGSNNADQVDILGDARTIFEKMRMQIKLLPACFRPAVADGVELKLKVCRNPDSGAVISGEIGKNIGRGGRSRIYFVDEAAHIEHPEAAEASLSETTRCRIDVSSVSGPIRVFFRMRMAGREWEPGQPVVKDRANVFIMDMLDHPERTPAWAAEKRAFYAAQGTPAIMAREYERDYSGAPEGIMIPRAWTEAAIDAHLRLGFDGDGGWWGGLDLADEGPDLNALVRGRGSVVKYAEEITERDPGAVARRAFLACRQTSPIMLQYDSGGGFGGSVKSEFNRVGKDEGVDISWLTLVSWSAAAKVLDPADPILRSDKTAPTNKNFFENFKAQAWWNVARTFYRTWQMVQHAEGRSDEVVDYPSEQLISLASATIPPAVMSKLVTELSQATAGQSTRLKLLVNKAPEGAKSPNLADALIMGRFPARAAYVPHVGLTAPKVFVG